VWGLLGTCLLKGFPAVLSIMAIDGGAVILHKLHIRGALITG
jgi:hypothetical protein